MQKHNIKPFARLNYSITLLHPVDGIKFVCPVEWISEDLGKPLTEILEFLHKHKLPLTHIEGHGFGITNLEVEKLANFYTKGNEHDED